MKTRTPRLPTPSKARLGYMTQFADQAWVIYPFVLKEQRPGDVRLAFVEIGLRIA